MATLVPCPSRDSRGRVLSPLQFNFLVNRLAASVRQAAPGVQFGVSYRFTNKLYADEVVTTECLCLGAMAVLLRSTFLSGQELPLVSENPYLGVILTPSLSWTAHARHLVSRGNSLFSALLGASQNVSRCGSRPPFSCLTCCRAYLGEWNFSCHLHPLRGFLLGWPASSPNVSVFLELGWPDAVHISTDCSLTLAGCTAMPCG